MLLRRVEGIGECQRGCQRECWAVAGVKAWRANGRRARVDAMDASGHEGGCRRSPPPGRRLPFRARMAGCPLSAACPTIPSQTRRARPGDPALARAPDPASVDQPTVDLISLTPLAPAVCGVLLTLRISIQPRARIQSPLCRRTLHYNDNPATLLTTPPGAPPRRCIVLRRPVGAADRLAPTRPAACIPPFALQL